MKDKNGVKIKVGDFVKRCGYVRYADGEKYKVSKKTWSVSRVDGDKVFTKNTFTDISGAVIEEEVCLNRKTTDFLVVGNEKDGLHDEYKPVKKLVLEGFVEQNYRVNQDIPDKNWKKGEIVKIHGKVSHETLEKGILEVVPNDITHQHVLVVVDPIRVKALSNT